MRLESLSSSILCSQVVLALRDSTLGESQSDMTHFVFCLTVQLVSSAPRQHRAISSTSPVYSTSTMDGFPSPLHKSDAPSVMKSHRALASYASVNLPWLKSSTTLIPMTRNTRGLEKSVMSFWCFSIGTSRLQGAPKWLK